MSKICWMSDYGYPGLVQGLEACGWTVLAGHRRSWSAWCNGNVPEVPKDTPEAYGAFLREEVRQHRPELLIVGKGFDSNVPSQQRVDAPSYWRVDPKDLAYAQEYGAVVVQLDLDSPDSFSFSTHSGIPRQADAVGTCCIGTREFYERHTQAQIFEFWPAWDQALRKPIAPETRACTDLVMIGTPYLTPNPDFGLPRREVVRAALEAGLQVELYGPQDWLRGGEYGGDPSFESIYKGHAAWDTMHETLARGRLAYSSFLRRGFRYLNDRVPIAAGAGCFVLMEQQLGLEQEFPEGIMAGYHRHRDSADLRMAFTRWRGQDATRLKAASIMQRHVLEQHTYMHRARAIDLVQKRAAQKRAAERATSCCGGAR